MLGVGGLFPSGQEPVLLTLPPGKGPVGPILSLQVPVSSSLNLLEMEIGCCSSSLLFVLGQQGLREVGPEPGL